jgi:membrane protein implicated in regulation of membrane protease activity
MTTLQRYFLFQIPGWVLAVIVLFVFRDWLGLPLWVSFLLFALYVAKDFALYPFLRVGYQPGPGIGAEQLIGEIATVRTPLAPDGYVRVRGELWRARLAAGSALVEVGGRVRVAAAHGMLLTVSAVPEDGPGNSL